MKGRLAACAALLPLLAACGGGSSSSSASGSPGSATTSAVSSVTALNGKNFVSLSVTGRELVGGTALTLSFDDGRMTANGGCNTMSGAATVDGGMLKWSGHPIQTMMACGDGKDAQEKWFAGLLTTGIKATDMGGGALWLSTDSVQIKLGPAPSSS